MNVNAPHHKCQFCGDSHTGTCPSEQFAESRAARGIVYENGKYNVRRTKSGDGKLTVYSVFADGFTHATAVDGVGYACNADGLSIAIVACDYRAGTKVDSRRAVELAKRVHP